MNWADELSLHWGSAMTSSDPPLEGWFIPWANAACENAAGTRAATISTSMCAFINEKSALKVNKLSGKLFAQSEKRGKSTWQRPQHGEFRRHLHSERSVLPQTFDVAQHYCVGARLVKYHRLHIRVLLFVGKGVLAVLFYDKVVDDVFDFLERLRLAMLFVVLANALEMNWVAAGEFQEIGESSRGVPALTAQAILTHTPKDFLYGLYGYVAKPFSRDELIAVIANAMRLTKADSWERLMAASRKPKS